ncbi:uncharacterized protein LOC144728172 isoform X2 [Lampetra planeri]
MFTPHTSLILLILISSSSIITVAGIQCYACVGLSERQCNAQGVTACPPHSDTCATFIGGPSTRGVMKMCSMRVLCRAAESAPPAGVRVHCCHGDRCNEKSGGHGLPRAGPVTWLPPLLFLLVLLLGVAT